MHCDCHVHTRFSVDSHEEMERHCQHAIARGLTHLCFTDHIDWDPHDCGCGYYDADGYFDALHRVQDRYADRLTVLAGVEFAEPHRYQREFEAVRARPYDYILASMHWIEGQFPLALLQGGKSVPQIFALYWDEMAQLVQTDGIDAVAHFDFPKRYLKALVLPQTQVCAILAEMVRRDIALEINTSSLRQGGAEAMPGPRVLQWYAQQGGRHVVTGSDAHTAQDVGSHILQMEALARQLGLLPGAFVNHRWTEGTQHGL